VFCWSLEENEKRKINTITLSIAKTSKFCFAVLPTVTFFHLEVVAISILDFS
jgi:hypothetical protein